MTYTVYDMISPLKNVYFGHTKNFKSRMSLHECRYNENTDGSWAYVYRVFRKETNSFDDIKIRVIAEFDNKHEAKFLEQKLINRQRKKDPKKLLNTIDAIDSGLLWLYEDNHV